METLRQFSLKCLHVKLEDRKGLTYFLITHTCCLIYVFTNDGNHSDPIIEILIYPYKLEIIKFYFTMHLNSYNGVVKLT